MAAAPLHLALGLWAGMALAARAPWRAWREGRRLARPLGRWVVATWSLAAWAVLPRILLRAGCPAPLCRGWPANLFLFHPLVDAAVPGGNLVGSAALLAGFALQYAVLFAALLRARRRRKARATAPDITQPA